MCEEQEEAKARREREESARKAAQEETREQGTKFLSLLPVMYSPQYYREEES